MTARRTPLARRRRSSRTARTAVVAVAGLALSSCSGGTEVAQGASVNEFCEAFASLQDGLGDLPSAGSADDQAAAAGARVKDWADRLAEVGTPADISEEARRGLEVVVESGQDLPGDAGPSDLAELDGSYSAEDSQAADAFGSYADETCASALPTELPAGFPTVLPSGLPSDLPGLPGDLPDLPSEIPSGVPSELLSQLPSGVPTELPSGVPTDRLPTKVPKLPTVPSLP